MDLKARILNSALSLVLNFILRVFQVLFISQVVRIGLGVKRKKSLLSMLINVLVSHRRRSEKEIDTSMTTILGIDNSILIKQFLKM